jgi:hypothetical protein
MRRAVRDPGIDPGEILLADALERSGHPLGPDRARHLQPSDLLEARSIGGQRPESTA